MNSGPAVASKLPCTLFSKACLCRLHHKHAAVLTYAAVHKHAAVHVLLPVTLTCALQCCGRHLNGFADRPPVRPNMSLGDTLAGLHAAFGIVMALLHRQRNNNSVPGQVVNLVRHCRMHRLCTLK